MDVSIDDGIVCEVVLINNEVLITCGSDISIYYCMTAIKFWDSKVTSKLGDKLDVKMKIHMMFKNMQ